MILLADVQAYLKTLKLASEVYIGRIQANKSNVIGIYTREGSTHKVFTSMKTYDKTALTLLLHGTTSKKDTEQFAVSVYGKLEKASGKIGNRNICFIDFLYDAPIDVEQDEKSVYEYTIDLDIYVERS